MSGATSRAVRRLSLIACAMTFGPSAIAQSAGTARQSDVAPLSAAAEAAQQKLQQTFANLKFEDFGPAPIKGPIYQATAGGRIIYYAPESEQILFAAVYDKNGVNITALAQDASARKKLGALDPAKALVIGPAGAPTVIEFTDPGRDGTRSAARIGKERRQSDNFGFAEGAEAAGVSTREAARLDSFIRTLAGTAGNQVDMADGGAGGIADRARNERTSRIVDNERLTRMQGLLRANGVTMTKKQLAMSQNGDLAMNVTPQVAGQLHRAGLINDSQYGAIAGGGSARFSFADNDLLVSSSTGFQRSARSDTSTRFEAGKQAGPDTIEHFLGGGAEGKAAMANWLKGGFEMDRQGNWRLKPQVADTLQRDVQAIMTQTGWSRSIARSAEDNTSMGTDINASISADARRGGASGGKGKGGGSVSGGIGGSLGFVSSDRGSTTETAGATIDIVNYDVREAIAAAERAASRSKTPESAFTTTLSQQILGNRGLRNRYLEQADSGRGTADITGPLTSIEQSSVLSSGRFSDDLANGPFDGNPAFKERRDK